MPLYDERFRQQIANSINAGASTREITDSLEVSQTTVNEYRRNIRTFGIHNPPPASIPYRPRKIHLAAQEAMTELLRANPTMYLDEVQDWLFNEWDIEASVPTIHRCVKRLDLTRKKNERINPDSDPVLRALWLSKIASRYSAKQLVVVDESAASERTRDRQWGWSPRGVVCRVLQDSSRSNRWSILPAIGINGYLEYEIFHRLFTLERFENFIYKLLSKMNRFPLPRLVLVMDNVASHHSPYVRAMCEQARVILEYIPPYSPDLSPIEESFSALKAWMRKNRVLGQQFLPFYEMFLHLAVTQCNFQITARGFFRACGIEVGDDDEDVDYRSLGLPVIEMFIESV